MATGSRDDPIARFVRAARAFSGSSRAQVATWVGVEAPTIGRWERGEWKKGPPRTAALEVIARRSGLLEFVDGLASATGELDPARRFAAAARREAQRRDVHPGSEPEAPRDADAGGADS